VVCQGVSLVECLEDHPAVNLLLPQSQHLRRLQNRHPKLLRSELRGVQEVSLVVCLGVSLVACLEDHPVVNPLLPQNQHLRLLQNRRLLRSELHGVHPEVSHLEACLEVYPAQVVHPAVKLRLQNQHPRLLRSDLRGVHPEVSQVVCLGVSLVACLEDHPGVNPLLPQSQLRRLLQNQHPKLLRSELRGVHLEVSHLAVCLVQVAHPAEKPLPLQNQHPKLLRSDLHVTVTERAKERARATVEANEWGTVFFSILTRVAEGEPTILDRVFSRLMKLISCSRPDT